MATILLSAAGAAVGAGFGGTVLGLSGAVIGRAIGATLGRALDQKLLGAGSDAVDVGRVERFRLTGASEGAAIGQVWGRMRVAGQVIWATDFMEASETSSGGKGASRPKVTEYSYSVSLAIALCEGVITRVGRVWADGQEVEVDALNMRVYRGTESQLPDAKIAAVEGADKAPAYRGTAYVVIEDLDLSAFGNRVPQFSFEVMRRAQGTFAGTLTDVSTSVGGVALIPGTGEYALAVTAVHFAEGPGVNRSANVNSPSGKTDFATSLGQLREELPNCNAVSMVVSWFGDDLRAGSCLVQPKVEQVAFDGVGMPWRAGGIARAQAAVVAQSGGKPVYGGTPADAAVIEGIRALVAAGKQVMFYPFILMDQLTGNGLPDPYGGAVQAVLPWRGRITTALAPGMAGTTDRTAAAAAEVAAFFGTAQPGDFSVASGVVSYTGPAEWRYRRFILHYAHLCALAGGVESFCIGSEMVGLTQMRGAGDSFPAVAALKVLAGEVRAILGPSVKISYAADWSEYFGYQRDGNRYFHLDPLWADANIDFIGIDNYMPLSDWRDGDDHADAGWGSIYNLDYLKANVAGGEGFDWYYNGPEGEAAQRRIPITDGAHNEPWIYRYKDLKSWWSLAHHERIGGVRSLAPTAWVPRSKPMRFTEYGCAAMDKATNQPNKFLDPKSSESVLPKYSNGRRDDLIQQQYIRAMVEFFADVANNPVAVSYAGRMLDMPRSYVWAWDSRPFPEFPGNQELWSDGENYQKGHWLNGRAMAQSLAGVVMEICERSGAAFPEVSALHGLVKGYATKDIGSARAALQPLMLVHGFDAIERDGVLSFRLRDGRVTGVVAAERLAETDEFSGVEAARTPDAEVAGQVRLTYLEAEGDYALRQADASLPDMEARGVAQTDVALLMTGAEARVVAERWLAEARVARDAARLALPPSALAFGPGDVLTLDAQRYRVDRVERGDYQIVDAVRIEPGVYQPSDAADERVVMRRFAAPLPVYPLFLDLPLLTGDEVPQAPYVAATARPWPGAVGVWSSDSDDGYVLNKTLAAASIVGITKTALAAAPPGVWDRGPAVQVRLLGQGALSSATESAVFAGANALAIGDGSAERWEVLQFRDAVLVGPNTYAISHRLRGQAGSDGIMPALWHAGSTVVLLNRNVRQVDLASSARGVEKHYRLGALARGPADPATVLRVLAFEGIGLRPYAVCHMARRVNMDGSVTVSWVRRTRIDGDSWQLAEVPLAEDIQEYRVRVRVGAGVVREETVSAAVWSYSLANQTADGALGAHQIEVAQVSSRFGPGPYRVLTVE